MIICMKINCEYYPYCMDKTRIFTNFKIIALIIPCAHRKIASTYRTRITLSTFYPTYMVNFFIWPRGKQNSSKLEYGTIRTVAKRKRKRLRPETESWQKYNSKINQRRISIEPVAENESSHTPHDNLNSHWMRMTILCSEQIDASRK